MDHLNQPLFALQISASSHSLRIPQTQHVSFVYTVLHRTSCQLCHTFYTHLQCFLDQVLNCRWANWHICLCRFLIQHPPKDGMRIRQQNLSAGSLEEGSNLGRARVCRQSFWTLLHSVWCVTYQQASICFLFSSSHPWKSVCRNESYHHLLLSISQSLPVPGATDEHVVLPSVFCEAQLLPSLNGPQASKDRKTGSPSLLVLQSHVQRLPKNYLIKNLIRNGEDEIICLLPSHRKNVNTIIIFSKIRMINSKELQKIHGKWTYK